MEPRPHRRHRRNHQHQAEQSRLEHAPAFEHEPNRDRQQWQSNIGGLLGHVAGETGGGVPKKPIADPRAIVRVGTTKLSKSLECQFVE